jgi:hypothetical protein
MSIDSVGNVGIGTTTPTQKLTINGYMNFESGNVAIIGSGTGASNLDIYQGTVDAADNAAVRIGGGGDVLDSRGAIVNARGNENAVNPGYLVLSAGNVAGGQIQFETSATNQVVIDASGNVGIGAGVPGYQLELSTDSAGKPTTNTWTISSDERIKTNIQDFTAGLDEVLAIRPVTYEYSGRGGNHYRPNGIHIGIIGQEVEKVAPYLAGRRQGELDGEMTELVTYEGHALPFMIVNAIKELQAEIEELKAQSA